MTYRNHPLVRGKTRGQRPRRFALWLGATVLLSIAVMGCASSEERQRADLQKDGDTCQSFGASHGSPEYSECMLVQQRRRDTEMTDLLEKQRLSTEIANTNLETVRKMQCERDAKEDRKRGERPRSCR